MQNCTWAQSWAWPLRWITIHLFYYHASSYSTYTWRDLIKSIIPGQKLISPVKLKVAHEQNRKYPQFSLASIQMSKLYTQHNRINIVLFSNLHSTFSCCQLLTNDGQLLRINWYSISAMHLHVCKCKNLDACSTSRITHAVFMKVFKPDCITHPFQKCLKLFLLNQTHHLILSSYIPTGYNVKDVHRELPMVVVVTPKINYVSYISSFDDRNYTDRWLLHHWRKKETHDNSFLCSKINKYTQKNQPINT